MKPENQVELKKMLIKRYSELCHIKGEKLIDKMEHDDWWEKEKYRLKVQYTAGCIGVGFVLACVILVIALAFSSHSGNRTINHSLISVLFSMMLVLSTFYNIDQKGKTFKILELLRE